jgi:antitoxin component of RelBE/YafQ-DinJ toxin-antitoxin module
MNIEYQTTTLRLVKDKKEIASKILKSKGLTLTQYLNLSISKLVDINDLPFIEVKPKKGYSQDDLDFIDQIHKQIKTPKLKSLTSDEIDQELWKEEMKK